MTETDERHPCQDEIPQRYRRAKPCRLHPDARWRVAVVERGLRGTQCEAARYGAMVGGRTADGPVGRRLRMIAEQCERAGTPTAGRSPGRGRQSLDCYTKAFRRIVSDIKGILADRKYVAKGSGATVWQKAVDAVDLGSISPIRITSAIYTDKKKTVTPKAFAGLLGSVAKRREQPE